MRETRTSGLMSGEGKRVAYAAPRLSSTLPHQNVDFVVAYFGAKFLNFAVRPEGAFHRWREVPPRELSIALVADERFGRVTGWIEAS
jgi:hypothetical protein